MRPITGCKYNGWNGKSKKVILIPAQLVDERYPVNS
jgi:hypothetical protein